MSDAKIKKRQIFLETCSLQTKDIHYPIIDLHAVNGALNPAGLGEAELFSGKSGAGQSSIGFETIGSYHQADETGLSPYNNAAEYGVVRTASIATVREKLNRLHGGAGAIYLRLRPCRDYNHIGNLRSTIDRCA